MLSDRLGHDLSGLPLNGPIPELPPSGMMQGHATQLASIARRKRMALRELRDYAAVSSGHCVLYATAEAVVDDMEAWFRSLCAEGLLQSDLKAEFHRTLPQAGMASEGAINAALAMLREEALA